jgi:sugar lactone lactonase YvrE
MHRLLGSLSVLSLFLMLIMTGCGDRVLPDQPGSSNGGSPPVVTPAAPEVSCAVSADPIQPGSGHFVAIGDSGNNRVVIYRAPVCTGQAASIVLGQPDFSQNGINAGQGKLNPGAGTLYTPSSMAGMAMDSQGNLWVADAGNCRVLEFRPPFTSNMNASLVIGQQELTSGGPCTNRALSASSMLFPGGLAFDPKGDLWVSDTGANRITEYVPPFSNGMAASIAIGYSALDATPSSNCAAAGMSGKASLNTLCGPVAIAFDANGDLWVGDQSNFRVLEFAPPFQTGMAASLVLGQPSSPQTAVGSAVALAFDRKGDLWVADTFNYRVAEFVPPFTSGMSTSLVLGQPAFALLNPATINYGQPTADILNAPSGLAFDSQGNLIVPTIANSRALIFAPPFSMGMAASLVLGQSDLTSGSYDGCSAPAATTLCAPASALAF